MFKALLLAASFYHILLRRTGGSETFSEKKSFFQQSLARHHSDRGHRYSRLGLSVSREDLIESTYRATRYFVESDWAR